VVGKDAFRTATGVHASAIIKARKRGEDWLADRIYSSVPAGLIGCQQVIEVGPMSGESNVVYWLEERGFEATPELVKEIFLKAKSSLAVLEESEILEICSARGITPAAVPQAVS
jgi:2-isopropylmalate synthase